MSGPITILLADDHTLFRQGLRRVLELEEGFQVVAEAASAGEAVALAAAHRPDVAVLDISMPGGGLEATAQLRACHPHMGIVVLTMHEEQDYLLQAIRAGANAYLVKDVESRDLAAAIRAAREGRQYLQPKMAGALWDMARGQRQEPPRPPLPQLTQRELEVLRLVGQGATNRQIAQALYISEKTAKNHLTHIFEKIGVQDRTQAALWAIRAGLVPLDRSPGPPPRR